MSAPAYPAARVVAGKAAAHFRHHASAARAQGRTPVAAEPDTGVIEAMIDAAFWASLRREEGITPRISLAYLPPGESGKALTFKHALPLQATALAKLAPAVERPGVHLGIWRDGDDLRVWGTTRNLPPYCFVIEVVASGLLVLKHRSESFGKFVNVAVLEGDTVKFVDERSAGLPDCPGLLKSLLGVAGHPEPDSVNVLVLLAASMRAHGRGGALLVVPPGSTAWMESMVDPIQYSVHPPFAELTDLIRRDPSEWSDHEWQDDLRRAVDALAGLTAVDGATLVSRDYELVAFGAKILRRKGSPAVDRVVVSEPIENSSSEIVPAAQVGGTRHLSAAQFVHDQRDAIALVASQDDRFTVFGWSKQEGMVHAHRVEALLL
jgi:hypothetical protein